MLRCLAPLVALLLAAQARVVPPTITCVQSVSVASEGSATIITVQADGALPSPRVGVLPDPPRIYLDFRGVRTATSGTRADGNPLIRGVRVAINQPDPLLTRVVVDLVKPIGHRIETGRRERGVVAVVVSEAIAPRANAAASRSRPPLPAPSRVAPKALGMPPAPASPVSNEQPAPSAKPNPAAPAPRPPVAAPPLPATPAAQPASAPPASPTGKASALPSAAANTPSASAPDSDPNAGAKAPANTARGKAFDDFGRGAQAAAVRAPAKDIERYMRQASRAIDRLETARPILVSLDAVAVLSLEQMGGAVEEFRAIRAMLVAIDAPRSLKSTHETLCSVCELGALAASTRLSAPTPEQATSAASAAAGALMLLERARAELGLPPAATRR